jgi:broad specificity phosphatase PhoE
MGAGRVVLWRHGRTGYNAEGRFQGQQDIPLDDVGLDQSKRAAHALASMLDGESVRILTSDLSRASVTAGQLAELLAVPVVLDARLREVNAGRWQGLLREQIIAGWPTDYAAWRRGDLDVRLGDTGETRRETSARAAAAITEAEAQMDGGALVCVSHGGALRGAILDLIGSPDGPWTALDGLRNAHWAQMHHGRRGWRLSTYNVGPDTLP